MSTEAELLVFVSVNAQENTKTYGWEQPTSGYSLVLSKRRAQTAPTSTVRCKMLSWLRVLAQSCYPSHISGIQSMTSKHFRLFRSF